MGQRGHDPIIQAIMDERGVTSQRAYQIRAAQQREEAGEIPTNIKNRVLTVVSDHEATDEPRLDANTLTVALRRTGYGDDSHSVTHILWSLQKEGLVRFQQRPRGPVGIRLTPAGQERARLLRAAQERYDHDPLQVAIKAEPTNGMAYEVRTYEVEPEYGEPVLVPDLPAAISLADSNAALLADFPHVKELLDRYHRHAAYSAAAQAVEALGEDDIALMLLSKTTLTATEVEVCDLLTRLGFVEERT